MHAHLPKSICVSFSLVLACNLLLLTDKAVAQVRGKKPDREVYQSPVVQPEEVDSAPALLSELIREGDGVELAAAPQPVRVEPQVEDQPPAKWGAPLVDAELGDIKQTAGQRSRTDQPRQQREQMVPLQPAPQRRVEASAQGRHRGQLELPHRPELVDDQVTVTGGEAWVDQGAVVYEGNEPYAPVIDDGAYCDSCDGYDGGCDSIGCGHRRTNAYFSLDTDRWFGSVELLMMFRGGDRPPVLVTTGPSTDADTAGEIGQADTQVLVGGETIFNEISAGGRVMLGTWLDCQQNRKLVLRGWIAGDESFSFSANQDQFPVLARPFLDFTNATDTQPAVQDTQLIAFPDRSSGAITVGGDSKVYGGDISVHQFYHGQYGLVTDLLYGYQYLRADENLAISTTSTALTDDFVPLGSVISVIDAFDVENEFHGGQIGIASSYREGCWSFRSLMKIGFGSLRRSANLRSQTTTNVDGAVAVDPNGLLVRSTNQGQYKDHTFAWAPELDLYAGLAALSSLRCHLRVPRDCSDRRTAGFRHDRSRTGGQPE